VLEAVRVRWPWIKHLFADTDYDRTMLVDRAAMLDFIVEVVRRLHIYIYMGSPISRPESRENIRASRRTPRCNHIAFPAQLLNHTRFFICLVA
jgi:hypothetical protein